MYSLPLEVTRLVILDERLISVSLTTHPKWHKNSTQITFLKIETLPRSYTAPTEDPNHKSTCTDTRGLSLCYQNVRPMPVENSITMPNSEVKSHIQSVGAGHCSPPIQYGMAVLVWISAMLSLW